MANKHKRIFALLLFIVMLISHFTIPVFAVEQTIRRREVRVGYFKFFGYHEMNDSGVYSGYGYEILQRLNFYNNWDYTYVGYDKSWAQMQDMLESGEIDLLTSAQRTSERMRKFDFSTKPIGTSATIITINPENNTIISGEYSTYNNMRVGMIEGNSRNASFKKFAEKKGFSYSAVYYKDIDSLIAALEEGNAIDAVVTSNLRAIKNERIIDQFDSSNFYVMVKKGNYKLLSEVNRAIESLDTDYPNWRTDLFNNYYSPNKALGLYLTTQEKQYLEELKETGKTITVLVNPDRIPYSYFENGEAKGIIVEAFKKMAGEINLPYEIIEVKSRSAYVSMRNSKTVDIVLDVYADYYFAQTIGYEITRPYLNADVARISLKNKTRIETVVSVKDADLTRAILPYLHDAKNILYFSSIDACINAVLNGTADCTYAYIYSAQNVVNNEIRNSLAITVLPEYTSRFSIGIANDRDYRLATILNKCTVLVDGDFVQQSALKYQENLKKDVSLLGFMYDYPIAALCMTVLILIICVGLISTNIVKRVRDREKEQDEEFARFVQYVCNINTMVLEVNIEAMTYKHYVLNNNKNITVNSGSYTKDDYKKPQEIIYPDDFNKLMEEFNEESIDKLIAGCNEFYFECRTKSEDGEYRWYAYALQGIPISHKHPRNFILFKRDIDSVKKTDTQRQQALGDALLAAQSASKAKGSFLSSMSHEIRTPLNAIIGYMTIAEIDNHDMDKVKHCLENSKLAAKHLLNIINDVLDISSIESGRFNIIKEKFDLKAMISTNSSIFYNQSKEKDIDFIVSIHELTEEWVIGDQLRVNQILMNLLSNAVKFTPNQGKVSLVVTQLDCSEKKVQIKFQVSDNGIGMSKEYLDRLFTPFEQESSTIARKFGGTGLGLSITKNLVTMMDGTIDVESNQGKGTCFSVVLPFERCEEDKSIHIQQENFSKVRAIVVDDERNECEYIKALLKRCGVKCDTVFSGEKAIRQIKIREQTDHPYDLCIMDWNMPEMDGIETAKKIRRECQRHLPIIIVTAYDVSEISSVANEVGVDRIISKPLFQSTMFDLLVANYGKYYPATKEQGINIDLSGIRVLLIEDNDMNMEIAVELLKKHGLVVDEAKNGQEATEKFINSPNGKYQAILMDIQMPVIDGYEATHIIRQSAHPQAKTISIIAMTANAFTEDVAKALACGMNGHVSKPIDYGKLFQVLSKFTRKDQL